jgi:hypothetical protein
MFAFAQRSEARAGDDLWGRPATPRAAPPAGPVQRRARGGAAAGLETAEAMAHWAEAGVADEGGALPHADRIHAAFGGHDLGAVRAHVGGDAGEAAGDIGAEAYAIGNDVAFTGQPDLHTAAHEAAHVVQQRAGVQLKGGISEADDVYERHADAVADRVVAGRSAADLLPVARTACAPACGVQRKAVKNELDVETLESEGADVELSKQQLATAATKNNVRWTGRFRAQILAFLHGGAPDEKARFSSGDAQVIAELQAGAGAKPDGIVGDSTMAILLNAGLEFTDDVMTDKAHPSGKPHASEVTIEFWPGEFEDLGAWDTAIAKAEEEAVEAGDAAPFRHLDAPEGEGRLYVKVGGKVVAQYRARGGPPRKIQDLGGHTADPTQGSYTVGKQQVGFTTSSWSNSTIPWGAHVRSGGSGFEWRNQGESRWHADSADAVGGEWDRLPDAGDGEKVWNQNDFGKMAFRLQGSPGFYLHTTPETEAEAEVGEEVVLAHSHGCVHLDPSQRDEMIAKGYLQAGVRFVCKKYTDQLLPGKARATMMGS